MQSRGLSKAWKSWSTFNSQNQKTDLQLFHIPYSRPPRPSRAQKRRDWGKPLPLPPELVRLALPDSHIGLISPGGLGGFTRGPSTPSCEALWGLSDTKSPVFPRDSPKGRWATGSRDPPRVYSGRGLWATYKGGFLDPKS